eukprot:COSAG04_NODE_10953_length_741_cov_1.091900_1_plen_47_part_10
MSEYEEDEAPAEALVGRRLPIAEAAARPAVFELALFLRLLASDGAID